MGWPSNREHPVSLVLCEAQVVFSQQWDLNTGQGVRNFAAHGAQFTAIALRPQNSGFSDFGTPGLARIEQHEPQPSDLAQKSQNHLESTSDIVPDSINTSASDALPLDTSFPDDTNTKLENAENLPRVADSDEKSDASFDPLFDGDDGDVNLVEEHPKPEQTHLESKIAMPGRQNFPQTALPTAPRSFVTAMPPKNAPPLLDPMNYATFSPDLLLTASIDGQVILWDRRTHAPGQGVGRLGLNEKTPPWCLSVIIRPLMNEFKS